MLSWIAAIIEGEGSIHKGNGRNMAWSLKIGMCNRDTIDRLWYCIAHLFGIRGRIYTHTTPRKDSTYHVLTIYGKSALPVLKAIIYYIYEKRSRVLEMIRYCSIERIKDGKKYPPNNLWHRTLSF